MAGEEDGFWSRFGRALTTNPVHEAGAEEIQRRGELERRREALARRAATRRASQSAASGVGLGAVERGLIFPDVPAGSFSPQRPGAVPSAAPDEDGSGWTALIEALGNVQGGGGGGFTPVGVDRSLFRLAQTPEEQALLDRELADIEARRAAGSEALGAGWGKLAQTNAAAAEKARQQVMQYGDPAAAVWTDAKNRAVLLAEERAAAAGSAAGRQSINVSPTGGAADFIAFMEAQAPAAGQFAQRTQETLASDLDWLASTATAQGQAYQGDLQRQANVMAFERAREHNRAVQDRIGEERMALADMEFRAASTNAELAQAAAKQTGQSASQFQGTLVAALLAGDAQGPGVLAGFLGLEPAQAQSLYDSAKSSPLGISLINQANKQ